MDLVEIRKKAKSRKKRVEQKAAVGPEGSDPIADPGTSPEEGPGTDLGRDAPAKMEENREGESRILQSEEDTGGREEESQTHGALTSLKGVLMSQREQEEEEEEEEQLQLLVFLLGQEEYALNIMDIKEIIKPRDVTEVPKAPDYIQGILSLRGTIIPVMDVNKRLGLPVRKQGLENRIVVVKWREHLFGLIVDAVVQVMNIPLAKIEPPPEILGGVEGEYLRGVGKIDDRLIILLNLARILALEEEDVSREEQLGPEGDE